MKCPVCADSSLTMSERSGIEIDYCPDCRGVWLDRGELDKIIERTRPNDIAHTEDDDRRGRKHRPARNHEDGSRGTKRRGGWLGELFEFGD